MVRNDQRTTKKRLVNGERTRAQSAYTSGSARKEGDIMIKKTSPTISNKEQLLLGLVASLKLLLVALALVVLFFVLVVKAIVGLVMVALSALNMVAEWGIGQVASVEEVKSFASFLVTSAR